MLNEELHFRYDCIEAAQSEGHILKSKLTQVGKQQLELTNLDKVLFPELQILKAEVIEYYLSIAPTILRHIRNRPLTVVRFPGGIHDESFFQKNIPATAPKWVEHCLVGKTDQVICNDASTLVWLASQACLEIHQLPVRQPDLDLSDYMVFDLDPPVHTPFAAVVELGLALKILVENHGYHLFAKSTGSKGLHLVAPLEKSFSSERVFAAAQDLARRFVGENGSTTTLRITALRRPCASPKPPVWRRCWWTSTEIDPDRPSWLPTACGRMRVPPSHTRCPGMGSRKSTISPH
jgi:bifunctional non-homologous end joining protein LigD